jgi:hypothetical protein
MLMIFGGGVFRKKLGSDEIMRWGPHEGISGIVRKGR